VNRIQIKEKSGVRLDVEIAPKTEERIFLVLWSLGILLIVAFGSYEFGSLKLKTILLLLPLWLFGVIAILNLWNNWVWSSRGGERITISSGKLVYERHGSFIDRRKREFDVSEITKLIILMFRLGDNRLQLIARNGNLYLGRNLSKSDGRELSGLLRAFLPGI
jgi:hypothetical protein